MLNFRIKTQVDSNKFVSLDDVFDVFNLINNCGENYIIIRTFCSFYVGCGLSVYYIVYYVK